MKKILGAAIVAGAFFLGSCATQSYDWRDWHCNTEDCTDKQKKKWCANMCDHIVQEVGECSKFQDPAEDTCEAYRKKD